MRPLAALLLLAALASAQSVDELVDRAMRATTGPRERLDTMQELLKREGGDDALARAGLDPLRDPEVVHATVEVLLWSGHAGPHMAAICRLLLNDRHREKVEERLYRYAESPEADRNLVNQLAGLARGEDPEAREDFELRRAAIKALGRIPHRDAVDVIASVWADKEVERGVAAECANQLAGVVPSTDGAAALEFLRERRYDTYADLIRKVSRQTKIDADRWKELAEKFAEGYFAQAGHAEVFRALEKGSKLEKGAAAKRARALAESKNYGKDLGAEKFAEELVRFLLGEMKSGSTVAARDVVSALATMARDQAFGGAGLPRAADLRDALVAGAGGGMDTAEFAQSAMELLSGMGAEAMPALAEFAVRHASTPVRTSAVEALGNIASRGDAATKKRVGELLAELLAADPPREVRSGLIFSLRATRSPSAIPTIAKLLAEEDPKKALDRSDLINSMELLALTPSKEAETLLERIAKTGRDDQIRIDAIEHGLVKRLRGGIDVESVLGILSALALDRAQARPVRMQVLESLGARGHLFASKLLGSLATDANLEPDLRQAASQQRLTLAERLVKGNGDGQTTREDLAAIAEILDAEARNGADPERLQRLALSAVAASTRLKIPGGLVRTRFAERVEAGAEAKEAEVRAAWKDAVENGEKDGLSEAQRVYALKKYRAVAKGADRVSADLDLLALAAARNDPVRFKHWLDALDGAVQLGAKPLADQVLARKPAGEFQGEDAARRDRLMQAYAKLR